MSRRSSAPKDTTRTAQGECEVFTFDADRVARVQSSMLSDETALATAEIFKALANPIRAKIMHALSCAQLCVCDLAQVLGVSVSTVSHHLQYMRRAGVLRFRTEGKLVYYAAIDGCVLKMLSGALAHLDSEPQSR